MHLSDEQKAKYLANLFAVARADGSISPDEIQTVESARTRIGAKKSTLKKAEEDAEAPHYLPHPVGSFSTNVLNLEDMVMVSIVDGILDKAEKPIVVNFARQIGVTNDQLKVILADAKTSLAFSRKSNSCPSCSASITVSANFCAKCGASVEKVSPDAAVSVKYDIPSEGIAIEFSESTATGFLDAKRKALDAPVHAECVRGKKSWYMAAWPMSEMAEATKLADELRSMRNRKVWIDGKELRWNNVFGFRWCSEQRDSAYRPQEFCFGVDQNDLNIWGCKNTTLDWDKWSELFSYGKFTSQTTFVFDKKRIRHELHNELASFCFCPHLDFRLLEAVLEAFPDEVEVEEDGSWDYNEDCDERPGSIQVKREVTEYDETYSDEFFTSAVVPRSPEVGLKILRKAISACGYNETDFESVLANSASFPTMRKKRIARRRIV